MLNIEPEERFRGIVKCPRSSCAQRWFVEPLDAGNLRYQLEDRYADVRVVRDIMARLNLPAVIAEPMFLQMPIGGELWEGYVRDRDPVARNRTIRLLHRIVDTLHRRTG